MNKNILVTYRSVTGLTKAYAEMIGKQLHGDVMNFDEIHTETMSQYDTIIFGSRLFAGAVDGLKQAKEMYHDSDASDLIVFACGATPMDAVSIIEETWHHNFTLEEEKEIPHFYMRGGLRFEEMPFKDKMMIKMYAFMMRHKKNKSEDEKTMETVLFDAKDHSSSDFIKPLIAYVQAHSTNSHDPS